MSQFSICISSVIEKEDGFYDYRYTAKSIIEHMGHRAYRNPEDVNNQYNFERIVNEDCDFFVLIIGEAASLMVDQELRIALSRGIPILAFAKIQYDANGKKVLPSASINSIKSISPELYHMHISTFDRCETLSMVLNTDLQFAIDRKIKLCPVIGQDPPIAYTEGVKLIQNAKYRLVLAQRTSCLLLGPRAGMTHEKIFYDKLISWIKSNRDQNAIFTHYFSIDQTVKEAKRGYYDIERARDTLFQILSDSDMRQNICIRCSDTFETVPIVIGDTGIGFNFYIANNRYYLFLPCFMTKDSELQLIIANIQSLGDSQSLNNIKSLYDKMQ